MKRRASRAIPAVAGLSASAFVVALLLASGCDRSPVVPQHGASWGSDPPDSGTRREVRKEWTGIAELKPANELCWRGEYRDGMGCVAAKPQPEVEYLHDVDSRGLREAFESHLAGAERSPIALEAAVMLARRSASPSAQKQFWYHQAIMIGETLHAASQLDSAHVDLLAEAEFAEIGDRYSMIWPAEQAAGCPAATYLDFFGSDTDAGVSTRLGTVYQLLDTALSFQKEFHAAFRGALVLSRWMPVVFARQGLFRAHLGQASAPCGHCRTPTASILAKQPFGSAFSGGKDSDTAPANPREVNVYV